MSLKRLLKGAQSLHRLPEIARCQQHTGQWFRLLTSYVGLSRKLPFTIGMPSGPFEFQETSDIATFWQIFYRRIYTVQPADRVIIDAGANIGAFSLYALQAAAQAKVIAIEPAPDSCQRLNCMLGSNGMAARCTLYEAALGPHNGETTIQFQEGSQFRRTGLEGRRVAMMTLDSIISEDTYVDLLKMDIEGAEYGVLSSVSATTLRRIRRVTLEFHPQAPASSAISPLVSNGFLLTHYQDDGAGYGMVSLERSKDCEVRLN